MFRRFMIVCWVLFGVFAVAVGVGATLSEVYSDKWVDSTFELGRLADQIDASLAKTPAGQISSQEDVDEITRRMQLGSERERLASVQGQSYKGKKAWGVVGQIGLAGSVFMLLWILIWHVGRWIRLGKSS